MAIRIIGTLIGAAVLAAGLYYRSKDKDDAESRRIYNVISLVGAVVFIGMLALTIAALV